jgi:cell division protein ZapA
MNCRANCVAADTDAPARKPATEGLMAAEQITVTILGREYRLSCRPQERSELLACAEYVDRKMAQVRDSGKVLGADRIAVLVSLQIAQELFGVRAGDDVPVAELRRRLRELDELAAEMLAPQEKLSYPSNSASTGHEGGLEWLLPAVFAQRPLSSLNRCAMRKVVGLATRCDRHAFAEPKRCGRRPT